jgi:adenine phosphoribosyltransferase
MAELYAPVTDRGNRSEYVNLQPWWRDATVVAGIGELLASSFTNPAPTVIIGPPASGHFLGGLVASHLGLGFAAVRKVPPEARAADSWLRPHEWCDFRLLSVASSTWGATVGWSVSTD